LSLPDGCGGRTDINGDTFTVSPEDLSARLETLTRALDDYWIQWQDEYLLQLRERSHATRNSKAAAHVVCRPSVLVHCKA